MHPILFQIGPLTIRTYGLLVAIGLFFGLQYTLKRSKALNIPEGKLLDAALYAIIFGLIGARLNYIMVNWSFYSAHFSEMFKVWEGGLVFYGGFIAGMLSLVVFSVRNKIDIWKLSDILAPALALGHFFGRLGCFFAGCCYGDTCSLPWAVNYTDPKALAPLNLLLHPVQIYEALGNLVIFIFLDSYLLKNKYSGRVVALYLVLYSLLRFMMEYLRGDDRGMYFAGFSPAQIISILTLLTGVIIFAKRNHE